VIDYAPTLVEVRQPRLLLAALGALLVAVAVAAFIRHLRRPGAVTLGICIIAATLAPTSNLIFASGVVLAARTLYAPSIGAGLVVGSALAWLWATRARVVVPYAVAALAAASFLATWREVPVWGSSRSVLIAMGERQPNSYRVPLYWAYVALRQGRNPDALAQFRIAVARFPADHEMLIDGAEVALMTQDTTLAIAWLREALEVSPRSTRARSRLTAILRARGDSAATPVARGRRSD
jgi:tetratricopeptide (TPR) repeat protein